MAKLDCRTYSPPLRLIPQEVKALILVRDNHTRKTKHVVMEIAREPIA